MRILRRVRLIPILLSVIAVVVYGVLALTGKVESPINLGGNTGSSEAKGEELYSELSSLLSNPERETDLLSKFTFTTYVSGESFEEEFESEPGVTHVLQEAWIARNDDDSYFLDVMNLDKPLEPENYYRVTGTLEGSVYWTEDNEKITMLHIIASKAEPFTPPEEKANGGPGYTAGETEYLFLGAHHTEVLNGRAAIVVYFDFKNSGSTDAAPRMYDLMFYQGDSYDRLRSSVIGPDELDPKALNASSAGITDKTYAGKTSYYCAVYMAAGDVTEDADTIYLERYSDDYALTDSIAIPVSKDLKAMQAGS